MYSDQTCDGPVIVQRSWAPLPTARVSDEGFSDSFSASPWLQRHGVLHIVRGEVYLYIPRNDAGYREAARRAAAKESSAAASPRDGPPLLSIHYGALETVIPLSSIRTMKHAWALGPSVVTPPAPERFSLRAGEGDARISGGDAAAAATGTGPVPLSARQLAPLTGSATTLPRVLTTHAKTGSSGGVSFGGSREASPRIGVASGSSGGAAVDDMSPDAGGEYEFVFIYEEQQQQQQGSPQISSTSTLQPPLVSAPAPATTAVNLPLSSSVTRRSGGDGGGGIAEALSGGATAAAASASSSFSHISASASSSSCAAIATPLPTSTSFRGLTTLRLRVWGAVARREWILAFHKTVNLITMRAIDRAMKLKLMGGHANFNLGGGENGGGVTDSDRPEGTAAAAAVEKLQKRRPGLLSQQRVNGALFSASSTFYSSSASLSTPGEEECEDDDIAAAAATAATGLSFTTTATAAVESDDEGGEEEAEEEGPLFHIEGDESLRSTTVLKESSSRPSSVSSSGRHAITKFNLGRSGLVSSTSSSSSSLVPTSTSGGMVSTSSSSSTLVGSDGSGGGGDGLPISISDSLRAALLAHKQQQQYARPEATSTSVTPVLSVSLLSASLPGSAHSLSAMMFQRAPIATVAAAAVPLPTQGGGRQSGPCASAASTLISGPGRPATSTLSSLSAALISGPGRPATSSAFDVGPTSSIPSDAVSGPFSSHASGAASTSGGPELFSLLHPYARVLSIVEEGGATSSSAPSTGSSSRRGGGDASLIVPGSSSAASSIPSPFSSAHNNAGGTATTTPLTAQTSTSSAHYAPLATQTLTSSAHNTRGSPSPLLTATSTTGGPPFHSASGGRGVTTHMGTTNFNLSGGGANFNLSGGEDAGVTDNGDGNSSSSSSHDDEQRPRRRPSSSSDNTSSSSNTSGCSSSSGSGRVGTTDDEDEDNDDFRMRDDGRRSSSSMSSGGLGGAALWLGSSETSSALLASTTVLATSLSSVKRISVSGRDRGQSSGKLKLDAAAAAGDSGRDGAKLKLSGGGSKREEGKKRHHRHKLKLPAHDGHHQRPHHQHADGAGRTTATVGALQVEVEGCFGDLDLGADVNDAPSRRSTATISGNNQRFTGSARADKAAPSGSVPRRLSSRREPPAAATTVAAATSILPVSTATASAASAAAVSRPLSESLRAQLQLPSDGRTETFDGGALRAALSSSSSAAIMETCSTAIAAVAVAAGAASNGAVTAVSASPPPAPSAPSNFNLVSASVGAPPAPAVISATPSDFNLVSGSGGSATTASRSGNVPRGAYVPPHRRLKQQQQLELEAPSASTSSMCEWILRSTTQVEVAQGGGGGYLGGASHVEVEGASSNTPPVTPSHGHATQLHARSQVDVGGGGGPNATAAAAARVTAASASYFRASHDGRSASTGDHPHAHSSSVAAAGGALASTSTGGGANFNLSGGGGSGAFVNGTRASAGAGGSSGSSETLFFTSSTRDYGASVSASSGSGSSGGGARGAHASNFNLSSGGGGHARTHCGSSGAISHNGHTPATSTSLRSSGYGTSAYGVWSSIGVRSAQEDAHCVIPQLRARAAATATSTAEDAQYRVTSPLLPAATAAVAAATVASTTAAAAAVASETSTLAPPSHVAPTAPSTPAAAPPSPHVGFFAVYDGHGGRSAADFACARLPPVLAAHASFPSDPPAALHDAFLAVDAEYLNAGDDAAARDPLGRRPAEFCAGSTALVALLRGTELTVASLGDSRAILIHADGSPPLPVSVTHSPAAEQGRIEACGGWVSRESEFSLGALECVNLADPAVETRVKRWTYISRVNGELAVARAIGDPDFKGAARMAAHPWHRPATAGGPLRVGQLQLGSGALFSGDLVLAEPEVKTFAIVPGRDALLLLACDGLWEVFSDEEAAAMALGLLAGGLPVTQVEAAGGAAAGHGVAPGGIVNGSSGGSSNESSNSSSGGGSGNGLSSPVPMSPCEAARRMVEKALYLGSSDNVSVVIVMLDAFRLSAT